MRHAFLHGLSLACLAAPAAAATLSFEPASTSVTVGTPFAMNLVVADAVDLYAFQFDVVFDPAVLSVTAVNAGGFLAAAGGGADFVPGSIDNGWGSVSFTAGTLLGPGPGVAGSGVLASLLLQPQAVGMGQVSLANVVLLDSSLGEIGTTVAAGTVNVLAVPEPEPMAMLAAGLAVLAWRLRQRGGGQRAPARRR